MASTFPTSLDTFTNPSASSLLTSPSHALQHSDINDAVEALETKVGIGNTTLGQYLTYAATFPTGVTIGNGTVTARYCRVNDFVHYYGRIVFGSTSAMSAAGVQVNLPVNCETTFGGTTASFNGVTGLRDDSASATFFGTSRPIDGFPGIAFLNVGTVTSTYFQNAAITTTVPFTWTTSDILWWNMTYRAA